MSPPDAEPPARQPAPLGRGDQPVVAAVVVLAVAAAGVWWLARGGHRGELVDIDRQPPREVVFTIDVNRADWPELAQLPEVGPSTARQIVAWRAAHGPFTSPDDLDRVPGVGPKTLARIRPYLRME